MALEATHIRFALDLKDAYGVTGIDAYVAGSIYPDSRYVTGIDRSATHPEDYLENPAFRTSDFKKGWHSHLLCDTVQWRLMKMLLPMIKSGSGEESWIERTAIKILQDIDDVQKFDIATYLPCLSHVENPNDEDIKTLRDYNNLFAGMYADPRRITIDGLYDMWGAFGVGDELRTKVKEKAELFANDANVMSGTLKLYDAMIIEARSILKSPEF